MKIFDLIEQCFSLLFSTIYSLDPCDKWSFSIRIACYVYLQVLNLWQISNQFCLDCSSLARDKLSAHLPLNVHKTTTFFDEWKLCCISLNLFGFDEFPWTKKCTPNYPVALVCMCQWHASLHLCKHINYTFQPATAREKND